MAIKDVETKCYILALFIRNDGARFLLGSGAYEFKEGQQHFAANTMQNDVVEVQGNDGYLLAGQVRRPGVQSFDGYVGDSSTSKPVVEGLRRDFFQFFRKGYFYKVVYVFPDGSAIQRKRGFLVDAPVVQELYQIYPEYHVALNFEDINYYFYDENDAGEEIYGKSAIVGLSMATGGLVWDGDGAVTDPLVFGGVVTVKGAETINNLLNVAVPLASVGLYGDTYQQTYSGKNKANFIGETNQGLTSVNNGDGTITISGTAAASGGYEVMASSQKLTAGTYTMSISKALPFLINFAITSGVSFRLERGVTSATTTLSQDYYSGNLFMAMTAGETYNETFGIQLVSGSTPDYDFEPYVGGIPSPNPDYPQEVQTVSGDQTVEVIGNGGEVQEYEVNLQSKNLLDIDTLVAGYVSSNGTFSTAQTQGEMRSGFIKVRPNTTYTFSIQETTDTYPAWFGVGLYGESNTGSFIRRDVNTTTTATSITFTTSESTNYVVVSARNMANATKVQLEEGSTATEYVAYSSIELCKIGDYQDYIYKSGDDWYVHKETNRVAYSASNIAAANTYSNIVYAKSLKPTDSDAYGVYGQKVMFCTHATATGTTGTWNSTQNIGKILSGADAYQYWYGFAVGTTLAQMQAALDGCEVYYILKTPTDTQITDATLIGQLEALGAAKLYVGENNLMVTASGTNLPAELEVGYYTEIEDGYGFVWEEGRSPSNIIAVDSIDDVFPVLTITGETQNPILTNVTTGTIFQYNGTITASQTLVVDMMNQTATLNGTSVIGNVTGDWVYFAPGNNRVSYTAGNANAPDATIEWQEIVG